MNVDPRLRLRHLACFLETARAGSLAAAAERLSVTQPAASKTLRELEDILGQPLFDRVGRRLRLNASGRLFQERAGRAMAELERAQAALRRPHTPTVRIALGALPTAATDLVPRAALAFRETHPHCVLRISTGPNWLLRAQLREGGLDLVVGRMADADEMSGLSFERLYLEDVVAVVRADHPLTGPEGIAGFPLILPPAGAVIAPVVRGYFVSIGAGAGAAAAAFETVSLPFARRALALSDAVWFISRGVVAEELAEGSLRAIDLGQPMLAGPVGISQRVEDDVPPERTALIQTLRRVAAREGKDWG